MDRQIPRVLICDSNIARLKQHQQLASRYFYTEVASDEADGLSQLKKNPFHVVIIDKSMGDDFVSICLRRYSHLLVIAAGEEWTEEEAMGLQAIGMRVEDIFQYPFTAEDLKEIAMAVGFTESDSMEPISSKIEPYNEIAAASMNYQPESTRYTEPPQAQPMFSQQQPANIMSPPPPVEPSYYGMPPQPRRMEEPRISQPMNIGYPNSPYQGQVPPTMPSQPMQGWGRNESPMARHTSAVPTGIYSFYSPKGGVGKSTICTNMALALATLHPNARLCLVDFDIFFGNVASLLKIKSTRTVLDWVHTPDAMDESMVFDLLTSHPPGFYVLPAPKKAMEEEFITDEIAKKILDHLRHYFDIVLVDLGPTFRDSTITTFQYSEKIFMISDLDRMTLSDCYDMHTEFKGMDFPISRVEMIFNNVTGSEGITVKQATEAMPFPVVASLPADPKVKFCTNNKEQPIVVSLPKAPFAKEIMSLTAKLLAADTPAEDKKRFSLFSFLNRKKEGGIQFR